MDDDGGVHRRRTEIHFRVGEAHRFPAISVIGGEPADTGFAVRTIDRPPLGRLLGRIARTVLPHSVTRVPRVTFWVPVTSTELVALTRRRPTRWANRPRATVSHGSVSMRVHPAFADAFDEERRSPITSALVGTALTGWEPGRGPRFVSQAQRRAIAARDGSCVVPGCGVPVAWCDIHHVTSYDDGGPTALRNLAPLCPFHFGVTHRPGWTMRATDDGWFWWTTPDGTNIWSERHGRPPAENVKDKGSSPD